MNKFNDSNFSRKGTSCYKWDLLKERDGKEDILPFWIADSDYKAPKEIIDALQKRVKHGAFGYTFIDDEYKDIIVKWVKRRYNYEIEKKDIIPTTGVVSSLFYLVLALQDESEGVIVQTPVYNPFFDIITKNNKKIITNPLINKNGKYTINYKDLEAKMIAGNKIMILCNPHNPVGRCYTKEEIEKIVDLCKKHDVYLLSDEIHCDIILNNYSFTSVMEFYEKYEKIIALFAPSKTFNLAGLMGSNVIIRNEELREKFEETLEKYFYEGPNVLSLTASKAAYTLCDKWVDDQRKHITNNFKVLKKYFKDNMPRVKVTNLEATYLVWLDFRYLNISCEELNNGLINEGVYLNKGCMYCEDYEGFLRFNIACSKEEMLKGLEIIKNHIKKVEK